jgi:hypothetical protein
MSRNIISVVKYYSASFQNTELSALMFIFVRNIVNLRLHVSFIYFPICHRLRYLLLDTTRQRSGKLRASCLTLSLPLRETAYWKDCGVTPTASTFLSHLVLQTDSQSCPFLRTLLPVNNVTICLWNPTQATDKWRKDNSLISELRLA